MSKNTKPEVIQFTNRQIEAEEYIKAHKINELFASITSHLVFNKPGRYLIYPKFLLCISCCLFNLLHKY
jgi:hypothetical protein